MDFVFTNRLERVCFAVERVALAGVFEQLDRVWMTHFFEELSTQKESILRLQ